MKKTLVIIIALLSVSGTLTARDFDAVTPSGHTIYCDIVVGGVKIVGWEHSPTDTEPMHLVIPSMVSNGSVNMRVVAIGESAFLYTKRMVSVEIPSTVRTIGREAFRGCVGLGSVAIPSTVDSIGEDAFLYVPNVEYTGAAQGAPWGALNLNAYHEGQYYYADSQKSHIVCCERDATEAVIPATVTSIGDNAFCYCCNITTVAVDSTVEHMGGSVFSNCFGLESAVFNPRLPDVFAGDNAFNGCVNLRQVTFGDAVAYIPNWLCQGCTSLEEVTIPDNITASGTAAFRNCTSLETVVFGDGITAIGNSMFEGCTSLRQAFMPDNLATLGLNAFENCSSLESVYLGRHLVYIGTMTFAGCRSLAEIDLPSSVTNVGTRAFTGCRNVGRIVCMNNTVPAVESGAFDSIATDIEVIVPCNKTGAYSSDSQWGRFDSIVGKSYYMVVTTNNPAWGHAVATRQPTCEDDVAVIEAIPEEGCRFVRWSDGNTDNPRQIAYDGEGYAYRKAIFASTVGVDAVEELANVNVYASHGAIVVEGAQGEQVRVFDMTGRQIADCEVRNSKYEIRNPEVPHPGVYIVRVGNRKAKKLIW